MFKTAMATSLVALLATSGLALAQGQKDGGSGGGGGGAPAERSAPSSGSGSGAPGGQSGTATDAPSKQDAAPGKADGASKDGGRAAAPESRKDGATPPTKESQKDRGKDGPRTGQAPGDGQAKDTPRADRKADDTKGDRGKSAADSKSDRTKSDRDAQKAGDQKDNSRTGDAAPKAGETNQDAAASKDRDRTRQFSGNLKPEQRTRVRSVFARHRREAVVNINIQPRVGVSIPRSVKLVTIPNDLFVIVPEYREYRYFIVDNAAYIVDPDTFVIVDVVELI